MHDPLADYLCPFPVERERRISKKDFPDPVIFDNVLYFSKNMLRASRAPFLSLYERIGAIERAGVWAAAAGLHRGDTLSEQNVPVFFIGQQLPGRKG